MVFQQSLELQKRIPEFNLENKKITVFWVGDFSETDNGGTKNIFTENIFIKNSLSRVLSYLLSIRTL